MNGEPNYWTTVFKRRVTRRGVLVGGLGLAGAAVIGCNTSSTSPTATTGAGGTVPTNVAPTTAPVSQIQKGGRLIINLGMDPSNLDPQIGTIGYDPSYEYYIYDPLVGLDKNGKPDPTVSLAERWDYQDTILTFYLRKGIKFTDGTDFNADAVKFNIERVLDPANKSAGLARYSVIDKVDVIDTYTVRVTLKQPNAWLTTQGFAGVYGYMVSPTQVKKVGNEQFAKQPVGTGAFMVSEWVPNSYVLFKKNPNYWKKDEAGNQLPYLDEIKAVMVSDPTVVLAGLQSGDIDISGVAATVLDDAKKLPNFDFISVPGGPASVVICNAAMPPTDDLNFRLAVGYAINPDEINQKVYFGRYKLMQAGFWASDSWAFDPNVAARPKFDQAKAKEYLSKAKVPGGTYTMLTYNSPTVMQSAELVQAQLKAVGIDVKLDVRENAQANALWNEGKTFPIFYDTWLKVNEPDNTASYLLASNGYGNAGKVKNDQLDSLIAQGLATYDLNKRKEIYRQVNEIMYGQGYAYPFLESVSWYFYNKKVQNFNSPWYSADYGWRPWLAWIKK